MPRAGCLPQRLELGNIKLAAVATDVLGKSGRAMLHGLVAGDQDPEARAELARGRVRAKLPELRQALEGQLQPHHRVLLRQMRAHLDLLEASLAEVQAAIEQHLVPFEQARALVQTLLGVGAGAAAGLIAELGPDLRVFPAPKHLASWAGVCPGNKQSGGKQFQVRILPALTGHCMSARRTPREWPCFACCCQPEMHDHTRIREGYPARDS